MDDIYDRSSWPSPADNPLVQMLERDEAWYSNEEIVTALGLTKGRALISNGTIFKRQLAQGDTAMVSRGWTIPTESINRSHGGQRRVFSRRALVLAAMRTDTRNAAAFRDWIATRVAE